MTVGFVNMITNIWFSPRVYNLNSSVSRFTYHHFNNLGDSIPEQADPNYLTLTVGTLSISSNLVGITSITLFITEKLMQRLGVGIYICSCRVQMSKLFRSRRYIIQIKEECGDQLVVNLASPASYKLEKVRAQRIVWLKRRDKRKAPIRRVLGSGEVGVSSSLIRREREYHR